MKATLVILLLLAAVIIIPRLAGASVGSLVELLFDKGRAESAQRRRINASYTTALPLPEVGLRLRPFSAARATGSV